MYFPTPSPSGICGAAVGIETAKCKMLHSMANLSCQIPTVGLWNCFQNENVDLYMTSLLTLIFCVPVKMLQVTCMCFVHVVMCWCVHVCVSGVDLVYFTHLPLVHPCLIQNPQSVVYYVVIK